jgi:hypothetical protein
MLDLVRRRVKVQGLCSAKKSICWSARGLPHATLQQRSGVAVLIACCRCLKKVQEGIDEFDQIWQKVG